MKKNILVVSKSPLVRNFLKKIIEKNNYNSEFAKNIEEIQSTYDLIILDLDTLDIDPTQLIKNIIARKPTRTLVIASEENEEKILKALEAGALDYIVKPSKVGISLQTKEKEIEEKISQILKIPKIKVLLNKPKSLKKDLKNIKEVKLSLYKPKDDLKYILIGASTGGPRLIETILRTLPENYPYPLCIVQHMPKNFTKRFAERLNSISKLKVVEAKNGEEVVKGKAIIGKGGWHLHFARREEDNTVITKLAPNTSKRFFVPSVDEMFLSALKVIDPKKIVAVLLTGIGDDGAEGMVALKKAGAYTIAESEETAVVYGMPKEAYLRGGATKVLPFPKIVEEILKLGEK